MSYVNGNWQHSHPCGCRPCERPPRDVFYNGPCPPDPDPCSHDWAELMFSQCLIFGPLDAQAGLPIPLGGICEGVSGAFRTCDCGLRFSCSGIYLLRLIVNLPTAAAVNTTLTLYLDGEPIEGGSLAINKPANTPQGSYVLEVVVFASAGSLLTLVPSTTLDLPNTDQPIISLSVLKIG